MLKSITIKDLAIIKSIHIEWTEGLNILTGETGAGKSILFDALSIALGAKANTSYIRNGATKAVIELCFDVMSPDLQAWLEEQELVDREQPDLVVYREITRSGSRARINGIVVNHSILKDLRSFLITFHAQHEIRTLMNSKTQLELLDGIADKDHQKKVEQYTNAFQEFKNAEAKLNELQISEEERVRRLDFARFQFDELDEANLEDEAEDEELSNSQKVLGNIAEIEKSIEKLLINMAGGDGHMESQSALDLLQESLLLSNILADYDSSLVQARDLLESSVASAEEAIHKFRRYSGSIETDEEALASVEERINTLAFIKRKYGPSLKEAISLRDKLAAEIAELENASEITGQLEKEVSRLKAEAFKQAQTISKTRKKLARSLEQSIMLELKDLGMERAKFEIEFETLEEATTYGIDKIEFNISTNPGSPPAPLSKIASGGELSRIMLALKTIFARSDQVQTVVFDEIDTGMSGKTLNSIRDKLARLAKSHQILSITHNPIVASVADNHVQVCKEQSTNETVITVSNLSSENRLDSIAQMASGDADRQESLDFARSLIDAAADIKAKLN